MQCKQRATEVAPRCHDDPGEIQLQSLITHQQTVEGARGPCPLYYKANGYYKWRYLINITRAW